MSETSCKSKEALVCGTFRTCESKPMPQPAKRPWPEGEEISTIHEPFTSHLTHYRVRRENVMLSLNPHMWSTLAVFAILAPSPALAQTVANSFEELRQVLKKGQTVVVTDASGERSKGKVADVSPSSLVVLIPEAWTFTEGPSQRSGPPIPCRMERSSAPPSGRGSRSGTISSIRASRETPPSLLWRSVWGPRSAPPSTHW